MPHRLRPSSDGHKGRRTRRSRTEFVTGWADGDLVAGNTLLDCKPSSIRPRCRQSGSSSSSPTPLLNSADFCGVAVSVARQGLSVSWPLTRSPTRSATASHRPVRSRIASAQWQAGVGMSGSRASSLPFQRLGDRQGHAGGGTTMIVGLQAARERNLAMTRVRVVDDEPQIRARSTSTYGSEATRSSSRRPARRVLQMAVDAATAAVFTRSIWHRPSCVPCSSPTERRTFATAGASWPPTCQPRSSTPTADRRSVHRQRRC